MKLPGTWTTVNSRRTYSRVPEPLARDQWQQANGRTRPPKRHIMASTHGREFTPPESVLRDCQWCGKPYRDTEGMTVCSERCGRRRTDFLYHCKHYGINGSRLLAAHIEQVARLRAGDHDSPVPTPYALRLIRDRPESGSDGVRMAASFHADHLVWMISENNVDLSTVPGFDC